MVTAFQHDFAAALLDPDRAVPQGLFTRVAGDLPRRLAVYRNNVVTGLIDALRTRFPATERVTGEEFFIAMAQVYVRAEPPRSPLLFRYGETFPAFIAGFEPTAGLPYLADLARLEAARTRACHAADAAPLAPQVLVAVAPDRLPALRLALHPSVTALASPFPVVTIWAMNTGAQPLAEITDWSGEDALIARPALEVEVRRFPPGTAAFVEALGHTPLGPAAQAALDCHPGFELATTFAALLTAGAFAGYS